MKVFISNPHKEHRITSKVESILSSIEGCSEIKVECSEPVGVNYAQQIAQMIQKCDVVIALVTNEYLNSQSCRRELDYAQRLKKRIIIITPKISEVSDNIFFKTLLFSYQVIVWEENGKKELSEMLDHLRHEYASKDSSKKPSPEKQKDNPKSSDTGCSHLDRYGSSSPSFCPEASGYYASKGSKVLIFIVVLILIAVASLIFIGPSKLTYLSTIPSWLTHPLTWCLIGLIAVGYPTFRFVSFLFKNREQEIPVNFISNKDCTIYIDKKEVAQVKAMTITSVTLSEGITKVKYVHTDKKTSHTIETLIVVKKKNKMFVIDFESSYQGFTPEPEVEKKNVIKCFIAGSIMLDAERNALRSAIAQTHNAWRGKNFEILSYTYEDFDIKVVDGGPQNLYDEFIQNDASIAVFMISGEIGTFTIKEFNKAMDAFKKGKHPQILIFNDANAPLHPQSEELKRIVAQENQYWTDYDSINTLKLQFMHTLDWMLIDLFYK